MLYRAISFLLGLLLTTCAAEQLEALWSTPVLHICPHAGPRPWHPCVRQAIHQLRSLNTGVHRSNRGGGWQSERNLLNFETNWSLPENPPSQQLDLSWCFQKLKHDVYRAAFRYARSTYKERLQGFNLVLDGCWANSNAAVGAWNSPHVHPGTHISGVIYLDGESGAELVLHAPRPSQRKENAVLERCFAGVGPESSSCAVQPQVGGWVVFPSWLLHHVRPNTHGNRVSISFNARLVPTAAPRDSYGPERYKRDAAQVRTLGSFQLHQLWPTVISSFQLSKSPPLSSSDRGQLLTRPMPQHVALWEQLVLEHATATVHSMKCTGLYITSLRQHTHKPLSGGMIDSKITAASRDGVVLRGLFVLSGARGLESGVRVLDPRSAVQYLSGEERSMHVGLDKQQQVRAIPERSGLLLLLSPWVGYYLGPNLGSTTRVLLEFEIWPQDPR
eukprot:TRINITY_DN51002_c0_g1_i2.p1 TRINITY_DN51002_c0_g1~~TRINITY_DN51002_c0_g1_i2.p1  ORF type:complete len:445 (-),score=61.61 TRINITY_DN51002_c0_g1_i2:188-1522(-)